MVNNQSYGEGKVIETKEVDGNLVEIEALMSYVGFSSYGKKLTPVTGASYLFMNRTHVSLTSWSVN